MITRHSAPTFKSFYFSCFLLIISIANAQDWEPGTPDYKLQTFWVNIERQPKTISDAFVDVMNDETLSTMISAAAVYFGVPPEVIGAAHTAAEFLQESDDGVTYLDFPYPEGWMPCKIRVERYSLNGPGYISLRVLYDRINNYTALDKSELFGGRTWARVKVDVLSLYWRDYRNTGNGVPAYQDGTCDYYVYEGMPEEATYLILDEKFK